MTRVSRRRLTQSAAVLFAVLTVAACGSTVQPVGGDESFTGNGLGTGGSGGTTSGGTTGLTMDTTGAPSTTTGGGGTTGGIAPTTGTASSGTAGGSVTSSTGGQTAGFANVPGITAKRIKIGVYTLQSYSAVAESAGFNVATGDQAAQANAVIRYINGRGGIHGRQIVPVFHDTNVAAADINTEYQAACADWTQDDRVYAIASPVGTVNNTLYACLARAGVITSAAGDHKDARFYRQYADYFYMPTEINMTRMLSANVDALFAAGYFGKGAKIGVVRVDNQEEANAVREGIAPALARHGLKIDEQFAAPLDTSASSAYSSAVLRFRTSGITHVIFTVLGSPVVFGTNAESQNYRPRYGLNSRHGPSSVMAGNMPAEQLRGSMGMGWLPFNDMDGRHDPGPSSPRTTLCLKLLQDAGQDTSVRATATVGLWICDAIFFIADALQGAPDFTARGFRAGAEKLSRFQAASTFRSSLGPGLLHDGAKAYRMFAFQNDCNCFTYVSSLRPTP